jgi:WD40 repeat protein
MGKRVISPGKDVYATDAFSPDNRYVCRVDWRPLALGEKLGEMNGASHYVAGLSFSRDGKLIAASTDAGGLQVWDVRLRSRVASVDLGYGGGSEPAFSPDGSLVAFGVYGTGTAWLVDVRSGKIMDHQKVSDLGCGSVPFSPDGRFLITPSTEPEIPISCTPGHPQCGCKSSITNSAARYRGTRWSRSRSGLVLRRATLTRSSWSKTFTAASARFLEVPRTGENDELTLSRPSQPLY